MPDGGRVAERERCAMQFNTPGGQRSQPGAEVFWGEIAPSDHLVQIYEDDRAFMDTLEGFVIGGLRAGESVITIATKVHQKRLDERLALRGVDVATARALDNYISADAEETLSRFMVSGWPNERLFQEAVTELLSRARKGNRKVRAFGEMVAVMWARGQNGATVRLEHLWHSFCQAESFSLFCAYPRSGFTQNAVASIQEICAAHSKVVSGNPPSISPS
jgi:hypothetical protein